MGGRTDEQRDPTKLIVALRNTAKAPNKIYMYSGKERRKVKVENNLFLYNNNNIYLLELGCHPVAVVILHVYKI